ncbi:MAG: DJ-1/PfpI family protein [Thermoanaerobaculia bacterium]|nr:DJ-1/PfpI family protein [Thermoanaerobaculia bacterium]
MRNYSSRPSWRSLPILSGLALVLAGGGACGSDPAPEYAPGEQSPAAAASTDPTPATAPQTPTGAAGESPTWRAGFVVVDGVYNTELMAPWDVLEHTAYQSGASGGIEMVTISPDGGEVRTAEGLRLIPDHGFDDAPPVDILLVPSSRGSRDLDLENERLVSFVRRRGQEADLVISLCWGAFVLAESGLLDGHAATTFPSDYDRLARRYPEVDLRVNVSFVHDGRFLTSQGGVLSYDVAMYVVDLLFGEEVATGVGRGLLIPWPRSQAIAPPPFVSDTAFRLPSSKRR